MILALAYCCLVTTSDIEIEFNRENFHRRKYVDLTLKFWC